MLISLLFFTLWKNKKVELLFCHYELSEKVAK
jgi:hypothetical protein